MKGTLLALALLPTLVLADLPDRIQSILDGHGIPPEDVSIYIRAVGADEPVLSHWPDTPRNPASVMKLVTTWTALELLGPAYSWPTEIYFEGPFDGEELHGDLAIKGYGDPFLVVEEFWRLLRALRNTGLGTIDGDLVLDDSYFDVDEADPGEFDDQPYRTYNVVPNALLVNFKAVYFRFSPDARGSGVRIVTDPVLSNLKIENGLSLVDQPCTGYQRGVSFNPTDPQRIDRIVFDGRFPARCRVYGFSRTVLQHDTYAYGLFTSLWNEVGGELHGGLRHGRVAEDAAPAIVWRSPPLGEVIRSINKNSNNVMTRQLIYTLGAEQFGAPGTREKGVETVMQFLAAKGWDVDSLVLENGAGLTRNGRISARLLGQILLGAAASPYAAEFIASMSLAGLDGTTRGRFDNRSGSGQMHVKTGRIDHVSALAGYLHSPGGRDYVIAIMMNSPDAHRGPGQELEEAVMAWANALD
jgi:D-alanyl-D-alanine carboxypeptidase/D-alanyl-D-alanine-endopeptidase (penicillin-binding protein 4)